MKKKKKDGEKKKKVPEAYTPKKNTNKTMAKLNWVESVEPWHSIMTDWRYFHQNIYIYVCTGRSQNFIDAMTKVYESHLIVISFNDKRKIWVRKNVGYSICYENMTFLFDYSRQIEKHSFKRFATWNTCNLKQWVHSLRMKSFIWLWHIMTGKKKIIHLFTSNLNKHKPLTDTSVRTRVIHEIELHLFAWGTVISNANNKIVVCFKHSVNLAFSPEFIYGANIKCVNSHVTSNWRKMW